METFVIIGGGLAGHRAATTLSELCPQDRKILIHSEAGTPYDRPPLSKEFLLEGKRPTLKGPDLYENGVILRDETKVVRIDPLRRLVHTDKGEPEPYTKLLIATGSRVRQLANFDVDPAQIHYLRTEEDASRLRAALSPGKRLAVVGGGFIGLEVSASARRLGCHTTVFELAPRLLPRSASTTLSAWVAERHLSEGGELRLNCADLRMTNNAKGEVVLHWNGGSQIADVVLIGIGIRPNAEIAAEAGIDTADGIVVNTRCETSIPGIYAAGEVTNYTVSALGQRLRSESWTAAGDQATVAAQVMSGVDAQYQDLPWFWSDQCGVTIQVLGLPAFATRLYRLGDPTGEKWLEIGLNDEGHFVSAVGVNPGREMTQLRRELKSGKPVSPDILGRCEEVDLSQLYLATG
ncbi:ferredoxin reductase [Mesorhizobium sp. M1A.F.Ca.IN.020.06.1.1]|uniref:NAD(P)/FAD-dependent oxidoreductase n=1 Tax=unclassified Mesorhizobium TaxID=325217 RepID=UPI000FCAB3DA|nr:MULTISPECIES: FAD-dependent oxidoreductase [unclassified Mesorhizobium]RUV81865.1 ferredoxin reductase [Mesorhizobium sp. M1A.F.Ca.IN.020.32.1.1]RUW04975.1 ferredoxin reductase [Mesorhizobium sp. M1A.F.Ca.IN.022.05.2.1]RUW30268.1 ferredoxin reductase [Mesorhizobium sp. M1A.F.Ca.IN.020.06.1.1]RWF85000.1 MAG: ferredoxin reductase [Mesorhizobium sp.]RWG07053.1 MAG: ferredoxin reductase [Mesorhizobium sp.]